MVPASLLTSFIGTGSIEAWSSHSDDAWENLDSELCTFEEMAVRGGERDDGFETFVSKSRLNNRYLVARLMCNRFQCWRRGEKESFIRRVDELQVRGEGGRESVRDACKMIWNVWVVFRDLWIIFWGLLSNPHPNPSTPLPPVHTGTLFRTLHLQEVRLL